MATPMIQLTDVTRRYTRGDSVVEALCGVTAEVPSGSFTAIVGPSGSGKSTLLNLIGALDRPSTGSVEVAGESLGSMNERQRTAFRRGKIGFVFQFFNLLPTLTAVENVSLPAELSGQNAKKSRERASALLQQAGLEERHHHRPDQLSGGEMQRVAVARALMMDPPLVVADEPTGNLDSKTGEAVLELLTANVAGERTLVLVTHDPSIAARAEHVLTMRDGRLAEEEQGA